MRIFEILTLGTLILALVVRIWRGEKRPYWASYFPIPAILFTLVHLLVEQYRWQMVPAYALTAILLALSLSQMLGKKTDSSTGRNHRFINRLGLMVSCMLLVMAIAFSALFPVFTMPEPTGPFAVGTTSFFFTDESRSEIFTSDPDDSRQVFVQTWYPAEPTGEAAYAPMWIYPEKIITPIAKEFLMPEFIFSHLDSVQSHSVSDAPLAEQESAYPVLIFSHGYDAGFFAQNSVQMESLASHGYVVFSIGHPYESSVVLDEQRQVIPMNEMQKAAFYEEDQAAHEAYLKIFAATGAEQIQAARDWMTAVPLAQQSIEIWVQDTQFLLRQIEQMDSGQATPFAGRLDTGRIGVFGQSFGGAVAFQVCAVDARCQAAINMDGTQWGNLLDTPLQTPFMMMSGENSNGVNDWALRNAKASGYNIFVRDAYHINFTDFNLVSPLFKFPLFGALGSIDTQQMEQIMNAYTLAFFDQTLKGVSSPLLQGDNTEFPEVELKIFNISLQLENLK